MSDERAVRVVGFEDAEKLKEWVKQVTEENQRLTAALSAAEEQVSRAEARVVVLAEALKPFADFADRKDCPFPVPDNTVVSAGSSMARRQLTIGECRVARDALSTFPARAGAILEARLLAARREGAEAAAKIADAEAAKGANSIRKRVAWAIAEGIRALYHDEAATHRSLGNTDSE